MNKIKIIIRREYLSRIKKKSFLVMTFLGPILIAALWGIPFFLALNSESESKILVVDTTLYEKNGVKSSLFLNQFKNNEGAVFEYSYDINEAQAKLKNKEYDAVLEIANTNDNPPIKCFLFYSENEPSIQTQENIKSQLNQIFKDYVLTYDYGMNKEDLNLFNNPRIGFYSKDLDSGTESYIAVKTILGAISGFLIYMFIFFFGSQVMRSVSEEKTNRIVEILVSSIKPVQLLMGKIIALALVGLTQFLLWVLLSGVLIGGIQTLYPQTFSQQNTEKFVSNERVVNMDAINASVQENQNTNEVISGILSINYTLVLSMFLFYFIAGYFLYASLFGAVGALMDVDTDAQQFTLPITIPLIIAMLCFPMIINNPSGDLAFWFSIIPLTSPMIMMLRIPFGVPVWEILLSMGLMLVFITGAIWLAAKIYRTGILMYGKNITYKEIWKWFKYKN
ncbi:MAG: ABC transporter permease [Bacteroidales bacterium]|jgi:ABC-2 type transport system permease protein|nr:ABC transporter permease [Bacteroidales bacterium]